MTPRVLLVGAYERDNFGDALFLLITERYLRDAEVVAAAPFAADVTDLIDRHVPAYPELLERERFDAVWTVGGQVGSIDVGRAYRLSAPPDQLERFLRSAGRRRRAVLDGFGLGVAPYIPTLGPEHAGTLRIVNSAGVSGIRNVASPRREQLLDLLRDQDHLAVRDAGSSDYLRAQCVAHDLVPDAVHAISVLRPGTSDPRSDVAVVQISSRRLAHLGHEWVAAQLAHSVRLRGLRLRFLLAGAAAGHDSAEAYADVAGRMRRLAPDLDVDVLTGRRPWQIVEQIQTARVVVASSLHVRIVASAYAVPRVSLARPKVTRYAQTWDPVMPHGVTLDQLDAALGRAFARDPGGGGALAEHAHAHLTRLADAVVSFEPCSASCASSPCLRCSTRHRPLRGRRPVPARTATSA